MLDTFSKETVSTRGGAVIHVRRCGDGPPLLLLHGFPQTHVMWHKVADRLARRFTLVLTDLRGYGDSVGPDPLPDGSNYTFREMANDQAEVMEALGYPRFMAAGHDRGARVTLRLAMDYPQRISHAAFVDIAPNGLVWSDMNARLALRDWHLILMAQRHDLPERLLTSVPAGFLLEALVPGIGVGRIFTEEARAEYLRCLTPAMIRAACADYRAYPTLDLAIDAADGGRKLSCPAMIIYGDSTYGRYDMLSIWRECADHVIGGAVPDCGHYVAEEQPDALAEAFEAFFT
jgi:haloacetate dehalogenase